MATTENTTPDLISRPIPVSIESDIADVTYAARAMYALLEGFLGDEESRTNLKCLRCDDTGSAKRTHVYHQDAPTGRLEQG